MPPRAAALALVLAALMLAAGALGATRQARAQAIALRYWDGTKCDGTIRIVTRPLPYLTLAHATFMVTLSGGYTNCAIVFNSRRWESFPRYCAVMVHEYGHLDGKHHSADPWSVMYPVLSWRNVPHACRLA